MYASIEDDDEKTVSEREEATRNPNNHEHQILPLGKPEEFAGNNRGTGIEYEEGEQNPDIPPSRTVVHVQWFVILVSHFIAAVVASVRGIVVLEISASGSNEVACPLDTCLSRRRGELEKFAFRAFDLKATAHKEVS